MNKKSLQPVSSLSTNLSFESPEFRSNSSKSYLNFIRDADSSCLSDVPKDKIKISIKLRIGC